MHPGPDADQKVRVLIVEDEPTDRAKTAKLLKSAGFDVDEAGTAKECLEAAREKRHDLIMLDETLPDGNGYELSRQIKAHPVLGRNCAILMSTMKPLSGERGAVHETNVDEWVTRPVPDDVLLTKVRSLAYKRRVARAFQDDKLDYRQLVENLHQGLWCIDKDANTTFVNERMADMVGYTPEQMLGQHLFSFMDERGIEISKRNLERRKRGIKEDHEFELLRKDGTRVHTIMQTSPITDADGNYAGALAGVLDITAWKQAEESLREAHNSLENRVSERTTELEGVIAELKEEVVGRNRVEGLFRQLLESAPDAMVVANHRGEIMLVSAVTESLFGYTRDELIGKPVEMLVPERLRDHHRRHRGKYNSNPHVRPMGAGIELVGLRKDGSEFPAEISLGPLKTEEGVLVFTAIRDVTERKRAEIALRESRERFDLAVRGTDAGIWDWDLRTNEIYYSDRWKSMLGHSKDEIPNSLVEWENRLHPDDRDRAMTTVREYLDGKSPEYELEHRLCHKDGSYRWILARGALVRDSNGKPYRMVGSHIDITRRKKAEESLRENESQLRAAQRIQEHLLPDTCPDIPGFDIAGVTFPADFAAGDYFDYFEMPDGNWCVAIGDVSGHGVSSALLMASTHAHMRSLAETGIEVDEMLVRANSSLAKKTDVGDYITLMLLCLAPRSRKLIYSSAGHPTCFLLDEAGNVKTGLTSTSLPLAVLHDTEYSASEPVALEPGDIVLMLTDGILEAASADDEHFGEERTLRFVHGVRHKSAVEIAKELCQAAQEFCQHQKPQDDLTAVVIKVESDS